MAGSCAGDWTGTHIRRGRSPRRGLGRLRGLWGSGSCGRTLRPAVHGFVGEAVGVLVFVAEGVGDFEGFETGYAVLCFLPEGFEIGRVDLVLALDLLDHELGVGDDAEA